MLKTGAIVLMLVAIVAVAAVAIKPGKQNYVSGTDATSGTLPGAGQPDKTLVEKFAVKYRQRGKDYQPRTRHLHADGTAKYTNRLFLESSPYLLQHAHNPVNWYPWGDEAFEHARLLNRPVLLSVGYSTCHWCHVMEEESFEDVEIATYLNENYVVIKVDREERPDVDAIYMHAVQAMTGHGGWPMTVWLTPDRKPFYGGTYFPARDGERGMQYGFLTMIKELRKAYDQQPDKVAEASQQLAELVRQNLKPQSGGSLPDAQLLHEIMRLYAGRIDRNHGGLQGAPKFPSSFPVRLMLRYHRRNDDPEALDNAVLTLRKMAGGGMHDQVGGGFHRYSTDERWLVPHFEKMLYDNALLAMAYLEAWQITGDPEFKDIAERILRYVRRDMTSPEGAFYSATDADSPTPEGHREEGWFFTWTPAEIDQVLTADAARVVKDYYQVSKDGNFEGRTILHTPESLAAVAKRLKLPLDIARDQIDTSLEKLYQARLQRPPPIRDEKILTAWNGLMISAYAKAGLILDKPEYVSTATTAARFILGTLYRDNRLHRSYKDGAARLNGYLDDYAFFTAALLDLYEATFDIEWLKHAIALDRTLEKFYEDETTGGFFMTSDDHETLLAREKPAYDGAEPSGNSVAVLNLLRLQEFTTDDRYRQRAEKVFKAFAGTLRSNPSALSEMLLALDFHLDLAKEIIIVFPEGKPETADALLAEFRRSFQPNRILTVVEEGRELALHARVIPLLKGKRAMKQQTTAYVCERGICELPTQDPAVFAKQIAAVEPLAEVKP